jgi:hypothetical protein
MMAETIKGHESVGVQACAKRSYPYPGFIMDPY